LCKTIDMLTSLFASSLGDSSCKPQYQVNEELNKKISLFSGDITKLEIDSIANAGESRSTGKIIVYIYQLVLVCVPGRHKFKTDSAVYCKNVYVFPFFGHFFYFIFVENLQSAGRFGIIVLGCL